MQKMAFQHGGGITITGLRGRVKELFGLPSSIVRMFQHILTETAQGNAVTVAPINAEMTAQEAAEFLNVSRPFVVKQMETGILPHHKVGTHRRIRFQDLLAYKKDIDQRRELSLSELTSEAQRLGLGY